MSGPLGPVGAGVSGPLGPVVLALLVPEPCRWPKCDAPGFRLLRSGRLSKVYCRPHLERWWREHVHQDPLFPDAA